MSDEYLKGILERGGDCAPSPAPTPPLPTQEQVRKVNEACLQAMRPAKPTVAPDTGAAASSGNSVEATPMVLSDAVDVQQHLWSLAEDLYDGKGIGEGKLVEMAAAMSSAADLLALFVAARSAPLVGTQEEK